MVSTTDPESGVFHKGEHKKCFAYEAHTACDKHNFVVGVHVTPGNIHDSAAFDPLYDEVPANGLSPLNDTAIAMIQDLRKEAYFGENTPLVPDEHGDYTRPVNFRKR